MNTYENKFDQPTLHVVDAENQLIAKGKKLVVDDVKAWWNGYQHVGVRPDDLVLIGVSPRSAWMLKAFADQHVQTRIGHTGPDGADDALLASIYVPDLAKKFGRWVIASGDGAFTGLAKKAADRGVFVQLVTTGDTWIAPKLWAAAHVHTKIRTSPVTPPIEPERIAQLSAQEPEQRRRNVAAMRAVLGASRAA